LAVFISHSFENKPEFGNVVDALAQASVPYWNPDGVKLGGSLRDQLRQAVDECQVCIFIATHRSLQSSWCGAELGAFWGAGKPIIVYIADSSLKEEDLPPIVQGNVWERRISKVVAAARELVKEAAEHGAGKRGSTHVGDMTVQELESLIVGAVSLAAATAKSESRSATPEEIGRAADSVVQGIKAAKRASYTPVEGWRKHILWVDDRPENNTYERSAFESMGIEFTLALSTKEALEKLATERFVAIISDMGRREGPKEGYVLLDTIRRNGDHTPFFIYAGSSAVKHRREAEEHGAQGSTNDPQELFAMVTQVLGVDSRLTTR
jgi:CheY-like chemotaxis protein